MVALVQYKDGNGDAGFDLDVDVANLPSRREALAQVSQPAAEIHRRAKRLPLELVSQAIANEPFEEYPRAVYACKRVCDQAGEARDRFNQSYRQAAEGFLRRTFHSLTFIPEVSFDIRGPNKEKEWKAVEAAIASYKAKYMEKQAESLREVYRGYCALWTVLGNTNPKDCFTLETILPSRYLPELLMIAPVWFVASRSLLDSRRSSRSDDVRYFCDLCASDSFAYLFQMYNYQLRNFRDFEGRDVMPLPIMELVDQVRGWFDYLVIATPYHDMASEEWREWHVRAPRTQDTRWVRNIDPFLFGFLKQIPEFMFFLGRWSGTGLFPLVGDMIADTIQHITANKNLLINFKHSSDTPWYREDDDRLEWQRLDLVEGPWLKPISDYKPGWLRPVFKSGKDKWKRENHTLVRFANNILHQFQRGTLFSWLRGESRQR